MNSRKLNNLLDKEYFSKPSDISGDVFTNQRKQRIFPYVEDYGLQTQKVSIYRTMLLKILLSDELGNQV